MSFEPTPHPVLKLPTPEQLQAILAVPGGREQLQAKLLEREQLIERMGRDPWRYGYQPQMWKDVEAAFEAGLDEALVMGGNRSSKSEFAARWSVNGLCRADNREWAFFHSSSPSSIRQQQERVYRYLPPEWRNLGKQGKMVNVCYTVKNGFADDVFILPNGSRAYFFNYQQDIKVLEGYEWDGAWADELIPVDFIETIRYRLITRHGKLLVTFTPTQGYTQTVAEYLAGHRVVRSERAPLLPADKELVRGCPKGEMPLELQCVNSGRRVFFFFTSINPFNSYEGLVKKVEGQTEAKIKERAYGWPEKVIGNAFPKFGDVHIIKAHQVPKVVTRYRVTDPGESKNWFIKWYAVDEIGRVYIYREWPDMARYGEWALPCPKNPDGRPGPAQRDGAGQTIQEYKVLILTIEGWVWDDDAGVWDGSNAEAIEDSLIDPRMGGATVPTEEDGDGTSIIDMMAKEQLDGRGRVNGPRIYWEKAAGGRIIDGIQLINDKLGYDREQPITIMNAPKLYVVEDCQQSIFAFREYTGQGGEKGAMKDVVDCDRYFMKADLGYIDKAAEVAIGGMQR